MDYYFECWILNDFIPSTVNCIMYIENILLLNLRLSNFLLKTDFSIHQIFPLLSKIWYSKWPLLNFFECWMLNDFSPYKNFWTFNLELLNLNCWLRFLHSAALQSKWQLSLIHIWRCRRSYACRSRWSPYH